MYIDSLLTYGERSLIVDSIDQNQTAENVQSDL